MCYIYHKMCHRVTYTAHLLFKGGDDRMKKLSIREVRQSLSRLDQLLALEGEVMITRRGEPIARVIPVDRKRSIPSHRNLRKSMPRMRKGSEHLIRKDRDER